MDYSVTHEEYLRILAFCTSVHSTYKFDQTYDLLMELLDINRFQYKDTFVIPERLMRRIAVANLCDMCLIQYKDSSGEIDYAALGEHTPSVITNILLNI